jgi:hypothetical protein
MHNILNSGEVIIIIQIYPKVSCVHRKLSKKYIIKQLCDIPDCKFRYGGEEGKHLVDNLIRWVGRIEKRGRSSHKT